MPDLYFNGTHTRVFISGPQGDIWVDDALGIGYNDELPRIPLYGYADIEFNRLGMGRRLVTGWLGMNYQFKNQLTYALLPTPELTPDTTIGRTKEDWRTMVLQTMDAQKKVSTLVPERTTPYGIDQIQSASSINILTGSKIDADIASYSKYSAARKDLARAGVSENKYTALTKEIDSFTLLEELGLTRSDLLYNFDKVYRAIDTIENITTRMSVRNIFGRIEMIIDEINTSIMQDDTSNREVAARYKNSLWRKYRRDPSASDITPYDQSINQEFKLKIQFGHPDEFSVQSSPDHDLTIEGVSFTGARMNVAATDDENLNVVYPFVARKIK